MNILRTLHKNRLPKTRCNLNSPKWSLQLQESKVTLSCYSSGLLRLQSASPHPAVHQCFFSSSSFPPPDRLLYVSLNLWNHQVSDWSKGQLQFPQTLQTHQMWFHIISIASSPCHPSSTAHMHKLDQIGRRWVVQQRKGGKMPGVFFLNYVFKTSIAGVNHFTTQGVVLEWLWSPSVCNGQTRLDLMWKIC